MALKIEKGIPIPQRGGVTAKLRGMEVGDSILVSTRPGLDKIQKRYEVKFTSAKEKGKIRIWRTA
jgi:hypothetical protein